MVVNNLSVTVETGSRGSYEYLMCILEPTKTLTRKYSPVPRRAYKGK